MAIRSARQTAVRAIQTVFYMKNLPKLVFCCYYSNVIQKNTLQLQQKGEQNADR